MGAVGGAGDVIKILCCTASVALVAGGCQLGAEEPGGEHEPYQIESIEVDVSGDADDWGPADEQVEQWFDSSLRSSNRHLTRQVPGMPMTATLHYDAQLQKMDRGSKLVLDIDAQTIRRATPAGEPTVVLAADARYLHPLSEPRPADPILEKMTHTLGRQAIDEVVDQMRAAARIRQAKVWQLVLWSSAAYADEATRTLSIGELATRQVRGAEPILIELVDDSSSEVAIEAARALHALGSGRAEHVIMDLLQQMSRDEQYDEYLQLVPIVAKMDAPWISIYLETVAAAHTHYRIRQRARSLSKKRPDPLEDTRRSEKQERPIRQ